MKNLLSRSLTIFLLLLCNTAFAQLGTQSTEQYCKENPFVSGCSSVNNSLSIVSPAGADSDIGVKGANDTTDPKSDVVTTKSPTSPSIQLQAPAGSLDKLPPGCSVSYHILRIEDLSSLPASLGGQYYAGGSLFEDTYCVDSFGSLVSSNSVFVTGYDMVDDMCRDLELNPQYLGENGEIPFSNLPAGIGPIYFSSYCAGI